MNQPYRRHRPLTTEKLLDGRATKSAPVCEPLASEVFSAKRNSSPVHSGRGVTLVMSQRQNSILHYLSQRWSLLLAKSFVG